MGEALLIVHQVAPRHVDGARGLIEERDWATALAANAEAFDVFATALQASGAKSRETEN